MAKVTGIGGVFFKSDTPEETAKWYREALGLDFHIMGGSHYSSLSPAAGGGTVFSIFETTSKYLDPSDDPVMINLIVDDVAEALAQVQRAGGHVVDDIQREPYGDFGWFIDPEGRKIELWTPKGG